MAKTKQQKQEIVKILTDGLKSSKSVVFANFQGLSVESVNELRDKCREQGVEVFVAKKSLVKKVCAEAGLEVDPKTFEGGIATFFGNTDEIAPAKTVNDFAKTHDIVKIFGGVLEGKFISSEKVVSLAKLPSKEQMLAQLVGTLNAPVSGFVNVLAGNLRGLVQVLNAYEKSKV